MMNVLIKLVLKILSSPKINMKEDYLWVRKLQHMFSSKKKKDYRILDQKTYSQDYSHDIPVRVFYPKEKQHDDVLLFFHGGGWVIGDIDTYTHTCTNMADLTGRVVYSVQYRLAPEHPYPAGLNDCYWVAHMLLTHLELCDIENASQITLIGDSAGGNLVAAVSLLLRDKGEIIPTKQILLYPVTYWEHTDHSPFESIRTNGYNYGLTSKKLQDYMELYEQNVHERKSPYISPLMVENFSNQPDTLVLTAEFDPLRDEGEAYGESMQKYNNNVKIHRIKGAVHGFISFPKFSNPVMEAYREINDFLNVK